MSNGGRPKFSRMAGRVVLEVFGGAPASWRVRELGSASPAAALASGSCPTAEMAYDVGCRWMATYPRVDFDADLANGIAWLFDGTPKWAHTGFVGKLALAGPHRGQRVMVSAAALAQFGAKARQIIDEWGDTFENMSEDIATHCPAVQVLD